MRRQSRLFFHLQKQRVTDAISFHVNAVVSQTNRSGSHYLEGDVARSELVKEVTALWQQTLAIFLEAGQDTCAHFAVHPPKYWFVLLKDAAVWALFRQLFP